ncbi:6-phosphogluconolactonase (cycloisomerase 2 family) [Roseimicrobium gellanilyticum]|uniref:6-phosphogluconolactonase (Cycloisomerase 2 family) n=2 Tax=Roseimicrobium gellanilyticum TaxID=748857 RepID=A0A366HSI7_9BACT|nr:6-phosphogluconolactonase (cycloisomerase 2 family) [Roseimicrobium gellanilyticum]
MKVSVSSVLPPSISMPLPIHHSRRSLLKLSSALAAGLILPKPLKAAPSAQKGKLIAYVGTYTSPLQNMKATQVDLPPGNGRGIHLFEVNRSTGEMTPCGVVEMGTSPSCLAFNAARTHLYSANETERTGDNEAGSVSAFQIDPGSGQLKLLNTVSSEGKGPAHLSVHPSGKHVLVANYFGGSVAVLPILADGSLGKATDVKVDQGTVGPRKATNAPPGSFAFSGHDQTHAHMIEADPSGHFVLHVDLGLDQILIWKFDAEKGLLTANNPPFISLPPGDGPRHFAFHPSGRWMYSIQEEGSTIVLFDYDGEKGRLTARQTISSLPPGFAGSNFCSEILVSTDGRFVYAGNRLHDSIATFAIGKDGTLTFVTEEWSHGDYPRSFSFDPSGEFLYSCNQRGDNIATFRVNRQTGHLAFTGHYTPVGNPSIIVFHDLTQGK